MLKPQAEPNVAEEQSGWSTTDQIFNFFEGYLAKLQHQPLTLSLSLNICTTIAPAQFFTVEEPETGLQQLQFSMDAFSFLLSRITVDVLTALMTESSA